MKSVRDADASKAFHFAPAYTGFLHFFLAREQEDGAGIYRQFVHTWRSPQFVPTSNAPCTAELVDQLKQVSLRRRQHAVQDAFIHGRIVPLPIVSENDRRVQCYCEVER